MSSNVTHAKEPLFRMVKRDAIPQKKAWMIRAAAFLFGYGRCRDHDART